MFSLNPIMLNKDNMVTWPRLLGTATLVSDDRGAGKQPFSNSESSFVVPSSVSRCLLTGHKGADIGFAANSFALLREQCREQWPILWIVNKSEWGLRPLCTRARGGFQCLQRRIAVPLTETLLRMETITMNSMNYGHIIAEAIQKKAHSSFEVLRHGMRL